MSAAEKLAALDEALADPNFRWGKGALAQLFNALPQIVAVVEAAEAWADDAADLGSIEAGEAPSNSELLHFALVALDEKLNGAEAPAQTERK